MLRCVEAALRARTDPAAPGQAQQAHSRKDDSRERCSRATRCSSQMGSHAERSAEPAAGPTLSRRVCRRPYPSLWMPIRLASCSAAQRTGRWVWLRRSCRREMSSHEMTSGWSFRTRTAARTRSRRPDCATPRVPLLWRGTSASGGQRVAGTRLFAPGTLHRRRRRHRATNGASWKKTIDGTALERCCFLQ